MITKEQFFNILEDYQKVDSLLDNLHHYNIDIVESDIINSYWKLIDVVWNLSFNEEGVDWINWWACEKNGFNGEKLQAYNEDGSIIPTDTVEDLWNLVKDDRI